MLLTSTIRAVAGILPYPNLGRSSMRLMSRAVAPFAPRDGVRAATVNGCRMELDCSDGVQRKVYMNLYERKDSRRVRNILVSGATFVDAGANIGYYTSLAAGLVGSGGRVLAFEPSPYAFHRLEAMVRENRLGQVDCIPMALADTAGPLTLYVPPSSFANHNPSVVPYCAEMTGIRVETATLDEILRQRSIHVVDLLKIDVEGCELKVLKGAREALANGVVRVVMCEFNAPMLRAAGTSAGELYEFFLSAGFLPFERYRIGEDLSANLWFEFGG